MMNPEKPVIQIKKSIANQIINYFKNKNVEQGGLIGSSCYLNRIDNFAPVPGIADQDHFTPNIDAVNRQIAQWTEEGICFCGFFHSHPNGATFLSHEDHIAIESWVFAANLPFLCFGIADGMGGLKLYLAYKEESGSVSVCEMKQSTNFGEVEYNQWRSEYEYFFCS